MTGNARKQNLQIHLKVHDDSPSLFCIILTEPHIGMIKFDQAFLFIKLELLHRNVSTYRVGSSCQYYL